MTQTWHASYFQLFLPFLTHFVSTNELTDELNSGVLDEAQDTFENHFRDMFLNMAHLKYITCMRSFKAALIAFLATSWLNWPRHCMHKVYFKLWCEMRQATARAGVFVHAVEDRAQYRFHARLTRASHWSEAGPAE